MAAILKFVRGIDLSGSEFGDGGFPDHIDKLRNLRWLRLNSCDLECIPSALSRLPKLEHLSLERNKIFVVAPSVRLLSSLRAFKAGHNELSETDIPKDLYKINELACLDFNHNQFTTVPEEMRESDGLLVLCLAHNSISIISTAVFISCTDLELLDLSHNKLETIPVQIRRLENLQKLDLSHNPLHGASLRSIHNLEKLRVLNLCATGRTLGNVLPDFHRHMHSLTDLDLSENELEGVPETLGKIPSLKRLTLADNAITELPGAIVAGWKHLESLNISRNKLTALPDELTLLTSLRRLWANDNAIEELPAKMGLLTDLEQIRMNNNKVKSIPNSLLNCKKLAKLHLFRNCLESFPEAMADLPELKDLDIRENPQLGRSTARKFKPVKVTLEGTDTYYVDFSASGNERRRANDNIRRGILRKSASAAAGSGSPTKRVTTGAAAGSMSHSDESATAKILKGLAGVASKRDEQAERHARIRGVELDPTADDMDDQLKRFEQEEKKQKNKLWGAGMGAKIDYSDLFDPDVGEVLGTTTWRIENFLPVLVDEVEYGKFYEADCYIILHTALDRAQNLDWNIYFWIGSKSTLDKKASAAMNAVNLRNHIGASKQTQREEQGAESRRFMKVFNRSVSYIQGGTESGFYETIKEEEPTRLYLLHGKHGLEASAVSCHPSSLHPDHCFMLECAKKIFFWRGRNAGSIVAQKARLFVSKMVKSSRKKEEKPIFEIEQDEEPPSFWRELGSDMETGPSAVGTKFAAPEKTVARLYVAKMGNGFLELPQAARPGQPLAKTMLDTNRVFILDDVANMYIWLGRKSSRLVRAASHKLALQLETMMPRPDCFRRTNVSEGLEPLVFKSKFAGWDDVLAVDYRRKDQVMEDQARRYAMDAFRGTAGAASQLRPQARPPANFVPPKVNVSELFSEPEPVIPEAKAWELEEHWGEELEKMESFVLQGKSFVRMPKERVGHFYSEDCYVFMCTQWREIESAKEQNESLGEDELEEELECVAYFWQGRDAHRMGWLTFSFSFQKKMEKLVRDNIGCELQVVREFQQRESMRFMALFDRQMVLHPGHFSQEKERERKPQFFHVHSCLPRTFTRTIEIPLETHYLNSHDCFVLKVPFEGQENGVVYVWIGSHADEEDARVASAIAEHEDWQKFSVQSVHEGSEPKRFFWSTFGPDINPETAYDRDFLGICAARFFICSGELGDFVIEEQRPEFCQDDLDDSKAVILDSGREVYIWHGSMTSDVVKKLSLGSAKEYISRLHDGRKLQSEDIIIVRKGHEPPEFTRLFHGWSHTLYHEKDLARPVDFLGHVLEELPERPLPRGCRPEPLKVAVIPRDESMVADEPSQSAVDSSKAKASLDVGGASDEGSDEPRSPIRQSAEEQAAEAEAAAAAAALLDSSRTSAFLDEDEGDGEDSQTEPGAEEGASESVPRTSSVGSRLGSRNNSMSVDDSTGRVLRRRAASMKRRNSFMKKSMSRPSSQEGGVGAAADDSASEAVGAAGSMPTPTVTLTASTDSSPAKSPLGKKREMPGTDPLLAGIVSPVAPVRNEVFPGAGSEEEDEYIDVAGAEDEDNLSVNDDAAHLQSDHGSSDGEDEAAGAARGVQQQREDEEDEGEGIEQRNRHARSRKPVHRNGRSSPRPLSRSPSSRSPRLRPANRSPSPMRNSWL